MNHRKKVFLLFAIAFFLGAICIPTYDYLHCTIKHASCLSVFTKTKDLSAHPTTFSAAGEKSFVFIMQASATKSRQTIDVQRYPHYRIIDLQEMSIQSIYDAIASCKDHEIVVCLENEDSLANYEVLDRLNHYYQDPKVWLTYGRAVALPHFEHEEVIDEIPRYVHNLRSFQAYTKNKRLFSSSGSCYAGLLKQVPLHAFLRENASSQVSCYKNFFLHVLGKNLKHTHFAKDILYVTTPVNEITPHSSDSKQCTLSSYCPKLEFNKKRERSLSMPAADLVAFSFDRPLQLQAFLESVERYVVGLNKTTIIYRASNEEYGAAYKEVEKAFSSCTFIKQSSKPHEDFQALVFKAVFESPSPYILFGVDDIIVKDSVDLQECAQAMCETGAYGFYLRLGEHVDYCYALNLYQGVPIALSLQKDIKAWEFSQGEGEWRYPNSLDMTLFEKEKIEPLFKLLRFKHPNSLEEEWAKRADYSKIGLCYGMSKIVNIPLNLVNPSNNRYMVSIYTPQELLQKYKEGLKMDIAPLHQIRNSSAHMEYEPTFIPRK